MLCISEVVQFTMNENIITMMNSLDMTDTLNSTGNEVKNDFIKELMFHLTFLSSIEPKLSFKD